jgi:hypothetical protein
MRWFYILMAATLFLASCQPSGVAVSLEGAVAPAPVENPAAVVPTHEPTPQAAPEAEMDECLSCHSDKDRLIETAKPDEESAESESKGVG